MFRKLNGLERGCPAVPVWVGSARFPLPHSRDRESLHCANRPNALQGDFLRPPGNGLCPLHELPLMEVHNQPQYPIPAAAVCVRPAPRFVRVDKAVMRLVEEPRSKHPGRELWIRRGIGPQFWNIRFLVATCRVLYAASHRFGSVIFHFSRSSPYSHSVWGNGCATLEQETLSLAGSAAGQYFVARGSVLTLRLTRLESSRDGGAPGAAAGAADDRLHDQSYQRRCQPEN